MFEFSSKDSDVIVSFSTNLYEKFDTSFEKIKVASWFLAPSNNVNNL